MNVFVANGQAPLGSWHASVEVLNLDALPAILMQLYANADRSGVADVRIEGKPTADGVVLTATGRKPQNDH